MKSEPCAACGGCNEAVVQCRCRDEADEAVANLIDEATIVVVMLDELADQIGDEAVFHRCRQRLRVALAKVKT